MSDTSQVAVAEIGLTGSWVDRGMARFGSVYDHALQAAGATLRDEMTPGVDDVTHQPKPSGDPLRALPRLIYDVLCFVNEAEWASEAPPIPATVWDAKDPPTKRDRIIDILQTLLMATQQCRWLGVGLSWSSGSGDTPGHVWNHESLMVAVRAIEGLEA